MGANQIEWSGFKQRSIIKYLVAEKNKPSKIYWKMSDVNEEACFRQKNVYKWVKHLCSAPSLTRKDSTWSGNALTLQKVPEIYSIICLEKPTSSPAKKKLKMLTLLFA